MTHSSDSTPEWSDCPPGEIGGLVNQLNSTRRRRTLQKAAAAMSLMVVLAFVATGMVSGWLTGRAGIACEKVVELAPQFIKGQTDEDTTARIEKHLSHCKRCRAHFGEVYPEYALPLQAAGSWNRPPLELASAGARR